MDTALITFPVVAGIITSLVTSVITRSTWSSKTKNFVAMVTGIILTIAALIFQLIPDAWPAVAGIIAGVYGVSQGIYLLLKPQLKALEFATTGNTHSVDELDAIISEVFPKSDQVSVLEETPLGDGATPGKHDIE